MQQPPPENLEINSTHFVDRNDRRFRGLCFHSLEIYSLRAIRKFANKARKNKYIFIGTLTTASSAMLKIHDGNPPFPFEIKEKDWQN